jgi:hydroxyethylthiazole kinase-like uncharacterized protein yjeF
MDSHLDQTNTPAAASWPHHRQAAREVLGTEGPWTLHGTQAARMIEREKLSQWPPGQLMAWSGRRTAGWALAQAPHARRIWVAVGPGGNGGDGLHAAMHLARLGKEVTLTLPFGDRSLRPDMQALLQHALGAGCRVTHPPSAGGADLVIDALLGLGASRPLDASLAAAVRVINQQPCPRLSVDLPTGLDAETGQALGGGWVQAHATLSLLTLKPGLFMGIGRDAAGDIWFDPLDSSPLSGPIEPAAQTVAPPDRLQSAQPRLHASHKGRFGDVITVGGAPGMTGALRLAARAALAAGAGRVIVVPLNPSAPPDDGMRPECMWRPPEQLTDLPLEQATVVCGCGGGTEVDRWLPQVLARSARLVLDADALNAVARQPGLRQALQSRASRGQTSVLTPHPLEAARLLGCAVHEIQSDRLKAAAGLSSQFASTAVLKGSGTVIASPNRLPAINITGNGALATGGTGDVLAGWLAGRWSSATNLPDPSAVSSDAAPGEGTNGGAPTGLTAAWESARAHFVACEAVRLHGLAADLHGTRSALRASDLMERMHQLLG